MECIFCRIVKQQIPATILYQDEHVMAFDDVQPKAPVHNLIIPKRHIATLNEVSNTDTALMGQLIRVASQLAADLQLKDSGYRLVMNCNADGGQTVFHVHLHLLGGRAFNWPPG